MHRFDAGDAFRGEAAAAQALEVHGARRSRLALAHHKRWLICKKQGAHGSHPMGANTHKLMHDREPTQDNPITHVHVSWVNDQRDMHIVPGTQEYEVQFCVDDDLGKSRVLARNLLKGVPRK